MVLALNFYPTPTHEAALLLGFCLVTRNTKCLQVVSLILSAKYFGYDVVTLRLIGEAAALAAREVVALMHSELKPAPWSTTATTTQPSKS